MKTKQGPDDKNQFRNRPTGISRERERKELRYVTLCFYFFFFGISRERERERKELRYVTLCFCFFFFFFLKCHK